MDGLPAQDRDRANRIVLEAEYERISAELEFDIRAEEREALEGKLVGLEAIQERLAQEPPRAFLLGINTEGDGQYIVANGNPDTADHTAVYVPGTTADLKGARGDISRALDLWRESTALGNGDVSTITWMGYDAPDNAIPFRNGDLLVPDAAQQYYALDAAPVLQYFAAGLDVARTGEVERHTTLIGHSYGSTVIGAASQEGSLHADDVIAVGSPGMLVDEAEDLGVSGEHVWSMAASASEDYVPVVGAPFLGGEGFFDFDIEIGRFGLPVVDFDPFPDVPSMDSFGGNILANDSSGHSDYWGRREDGSPTLSLLNQCRVIVGKHENVQVE